MKREDCRRLVEETAKRHGQLDVMVVNHGIALAAPATEVGEGDWAETIAVNLTGAFLCAQAAGRQMIAQGKGGSIILISSNGSLVGFQDLTAYGASKGGVDQLCRQLCVEWGKHNIRVNAVNPGWTTNNMAGGDDRHAAVGMNENVKRGTPMGRRGTVAEIAGPVVFLASDAAGFRQRRVPGGRWRLVRVIKPRPRLLSCAGLLRGSIPSPDASACSTARRSTSIERGRTARPR